MKSVRKIYEQSVCAVWMLSWAVLACQYASASIDDGSTPPPRAQPNGYELHADAQWQYDDNIYRLPSQHDTSVLVGSSSSASDHTKSAQVGADGHWVFGRQSFDFAFEAAHNWYSLNTGLDNTQGNARAIFNLQVTSVLSLETGEIYSRTLANFAYTGSYVKDLISTSEAFLAGRLLVGPRWTVFGGTRLGETNHSAIVLETDDFRRESANIGLQCALGVSNWIGGEYRYNNGHFKLEEVTQIDGFGFKRDYNEYTEKLLLHTAPGSRVVLDLEAGYLNRSYPDSVVGAFSGNILRGSLQFDVTARTQLFVRSYKDLRAYVEAESNYFVAKGMSVSSVWNATERIAFSSQYSFENQRFIGSDPILFGSEVRRDTLRTAQVTLTYAPRERLALLMSFQRSSRSSSLATFHFVDRVIMFNITTRPWMH